MSRRAYWTPERVAWAMVKFRREHGRPLRSNDVTGKPVPEGMPSSETIRHHFVTFRRACEIVYGEGLAPGGRHATKDEDTERVIVALYAGRTLTDLGRERGMSGQCVPRHDDDMPRFGRYLRPG